MKHALVAYLLLWFPQSLFALDNDAHPIVPGFERFALVEEIGDAERGQLLLNELNCSSCHQANSSWSVLPKQAPILTDVGSRVLPEYFEAFLLDPHGVKPGTTMPNLLADKPENERKLIAEALAHFLASSGQAVFQSSNASSVAEGEKLFHSVGCVACHDPQNDDTTIATSIPLGEIHEKYTLPGLIGFIQNPIHIRPSGRMPQFDLAEKEVRSIASYLLRSVVVDSKVNYTYYEGEWDRLPAFERLDPVSSGIASGFEVGIGKPDQFGIVYQGYWATSAEGKYKFQLSSDDGSRLTINGKTVVENDGVHGVISKTGNKKLPAGIHDVKLEFFEKNGGEEVRVEVTGGGLDHAELDSLLRASKIEASKPVSSFELDAQKAARGKKYFQSVGCAGCHEMKIDDVKLVSTFPSAKPLADLNLSNGCLSGGDNLPMFGLNEHQVKSIVTALSDLKNPNPTSADSQQRIHEKLATLNCYACHNREMKDRSIRGGVVDMRGESLEIYGRKNWFTGTQVEMGDEGQHPPALKSIGAKLNRKWLDQVLAEGANDRPYMRTRMPKFGTRNLGGLAEELVAFDRLIDVPPVVQTDPDRRVKSHGRFFAGEEALSCIKCHDFGKYPATGIRAIDLTSMTKRLNADWFRAYMLKPSNFRRGTRMPESWPGGKSFYPDILDGETQKQIDSIWVYLSDGENAAKPKGLVRPKLELKAVEAPKIYRNFIEGAGARAIGVGYPEQVNIAFDADLCRLALVWQEKFIDASRHWTGRGQGFEPPLGENVLELPDSVVFSTSLDSQRWSKEKPGNRPRFKGYRFDKNRRPIFVYQLGDVTIEDQPVPYVENDRPLLKRKFRISSASTKKLYYLAAMGESVEMNNSLAKIDGRLRTGFTNHSNIKVNGDPEGNVVLTIDLSNGPVELEQSYDW